MVVLTFSVSIFLGTSTVNSIVSFTVDNFPNSSSVSASLTIIDISIYCENVCVGYASVTVNVTYGHVEGI